MNQIRLGTNDTLGAAALTGIDTQWAASLEQ